MKGLLLTYAVVLFGAVISLRKPVIGLFIYVAFSVIRPEALWGWAGNMKDMSDIVAYPLLLGWAFQGFGSWAFGRARSIVACILMFTVCSLFSAAQAIDGAVAVHGLIEFAKTLLPFLVGVTMIKTEKEARQVLWIIVLMQTYVCVDMNRTYLTGYNKAFAEGFGGMDNNSFGISLVTTIGASLGLFLSVGRRWQKIMFGLATLLIMHTVMLTFSRGAFVGLLAVGFMALVVLPKRPKHLGAVVLAAAIGIYFTGPELSERLGTTFVPREMRDASAESRFALWSDLATVIVEQPILGVGPYNWPLIAERFGWPPGKEGHSLWVQTAAENGLPAVMFMLLFYFLTIAKLWPIARRRRKDIDEGTAMYATGIILAIVGFCVSANFVSLRGLEPPIYITMSAVILLKLRTVTAPVPGTALAPKRPLVLRPRTPLVRSS
jgi:O-antigen ligase/polysaccharide polymerase Wzy-like membrane protein